MKTLNEKEIKPDNKKEDNGFYWSKDVRKAVKELKKKGLKRTLYPKYLMLTIQDLKEIFGEELTK